MGVTRQLLLSRPSSPSPPTPLLSCPLILLLLLLSSAVLLYYVSLDINLGEEMAELPLLDLPNNYAFNLGF
jgi:hypothetical protein